MKPKLQGTMGKLLIQTDINGTQEWTAIYDADEIHERLLARNKNHFQQAIETPFGSGPLADLLGFDGLTTASDQVVTGTFTTTHPEQL